MLEPIDGSRLPDALNLLVRGFPRRSRDFWEQAVQRITRHNADSGQTSIGQLLVVKGVPVGVMLTLHQSRDTDGNPCRITNLSSWYVEPEHRVLAPLMLREMTRDPGSVYTDLTPSKGVARMLPQLGFKPLNVGVSAIALPLAALGGVGRSSVSSLTEDASGALRTDDVALLRRGAAFGAMAGVLHVDRGHFPLLFVSRSIRRIPAAELIYCDDNQLLMREIGAVARFLLKQGKLVLIIDIPLDFEAPGAHFVGRGLKFVKGECAANRTDYAGSELLLIGQ